MDRKRVFKTKTFDRWARNVVGDNLLCIAAREIEAGHYGADLGHPVAAISNARGIEGDLQ